MKKMQTLAFDIMAKGPVPDISPYLSCNYIRLTIDPPSESEHVALFFILR